MSYMTKFFIAKIRAILYMPLFILGQEFLLSYGVEFHRLGPANRTFFP